MRHPDTREFRSRRRLSAGCKDLIAADVHIVTLNGIYDWGWLRTDGGILMPPPDQLEEVGALATMVDENQPEYRSTRCANTMACPART